MNFEQTTDMSLTPSSLKKHKYSDLTIVKTTTDAVLDFNSPS